MAVINLTKEIFFSVSDNIKNIFSTETLFPYSVVTAFIALAWFFGVKITTMQSEINLLKIDGQRRETAVQAIKTDMVTREIFDLKMNILINKIDTALGPDQKKK